MHKTTILLSIFTKKPLVTLRKLLEQNGFERIPLKKLKTGHYKLNVRVNSVLGDFILDTGASTSCIGISEASFFKLISEKSEIKAAGAGAIDMETLATKSKTLEIEKISLSNYEFVLFDLIHVNQALEQVGETPVHGILGADILKKLHAVIDYGRNCVYLKK
ncbi:retroviral-like aspartic protease family protein [Aureisphaera sp. CAU 1614]|uniref:Retroviral-like aspartic protease family protein n=1 Tax=Halomarinibacterium sedimenti TaxID=2857106 RepID=A0A9X1FR59_9FLAO|nr:retroviral-like aspartic protease family protein [Halomarinibacterium sedimenti]